MLVALATAVIAAACRPGRVQPALPSVVPAPEQLLRVLSERRQAITSVRGFAQVAYERGEDTVGARHAILVRSPDHFRLEVLSPFGALAVVACDGRDLAVYARRESRIYRGPASAESVEAYTAVPVTVRDTVTILLGLPPERAADGTASVASDEAAAAVRLTVPLVEDRQLIWFAPDTLLPVASETGLPDGRRLRAEFGDYRDLDGIAFPYRIEMRALPGDHVVRVRYSSPSLNADIADRLFAVPALPGVEELLIEHYAVGAAS